MPNYNFGCLECQAAYDDIAPYDESGIYPGVVCPECGSGKKEKLLSCCNYQFAQPEGTDRWTSEVGGHGYRFNHKLPSVIEERKNAEIASHMGSGKEIYGTKDDLNRDSAWGPAK